VIISVQNTAAMRRTTPDSRKTRRRRSVIVPLARRTGEGFVRRSPPSAREASLTLSLYYGADRRSDGATAFDPSPRQGFPDDPPRAIPDNA
jgi:hypothetical protein